MTYSTTYKFLQHQFLISNDRLDGVGKCKCNEQELYTINRSL